MGGSNSRRGLGLEVGGDYSGARARVLGGRNWKGGIEAAGAF